MILKRIIKEYYATLYGNPLQYPCLENLMDGGAWWAAVHGVGKSQTRLSDFTFNFSLSCIGEGNGTPLQCSCLENPRDRGAWWAAVYGVAQSQTRLKQLSSSSSSIQLYALKFDNPDEVDQFFDRRILLKLTQEIQNLNRPISIKESESIINNLLKWKAPSSNESTGEFYQIFKEEIIQVAFNFFQRREIVGIWGNTS